MNNFKRKSISTILIISVAALLTIAIGSKVKAAVAWQHLWNYPTFRIDTSLAGTMAQDAIDAGGNYSGTTDLTMSTALGSLYEAIWRNDQGWSRSVATDPTGAILWGSAPTTWAGPISISGMPGSGIMQSAANYRVGNTLVQSMWRGNQGWYRYVPIAFDVVQWVSAPGWSGPVSISTMPGTSDMQAGGDYVVGNNLIQALWRNNQGWWRSVPVVNGSIQWPQATAWGGPININTLPGSGDMQAQDNYSIGDTYWQITWRNNVQWTRHVPIVNGTVRFDLASGWSVTTPQEYLPGSGSVQTQGSYFLPSPSTQAVPGLAAIRPEEYDWGVTGYIGYTYPLNSRGNCYVYIFPQVATGNCNTTTQKATMARILLNTHYGPYPNRDWLMRHEMGHVFGLWHPPCTSPYTVMYETGCYGGVYPETLQPDEINWINATY